MDPSFCLYWPGVHSKRVGVLRYNSLPTPLFYFVTLLNTGTKGKVTVIRGKHDFKSLVNRERDGERQWLDGRHKKAKQKQNSFVFDFSFPPPQPHCCFHSCCCDCVCVSTVTNKEVQIKSTIFRTTLCLLV